MGCLAGEGWGTPRQHLERRIALRKDQHGKWSLQRNKGGTKVPERVGTVSGTVSFAHCP
ncbi:MAG: hypothetical protein ACI84E_002543, partial [Planctomycetota bacterium]